MTTEKKPEFMQYDAAATRVLFRAIARNDNSALSELRAAIRIRNGEIGNAQFTDIDIRNGETLLCPRHRLRCNREHWTASATDLDKNHTWDADGVWFPVKEDASK